MLRKTKLSVDLGTKEVEQELIVCKKEMLLVTEGIVGEDFLAINEAIDSYRN